MGRSELLKALVSLLVNPALIVPGLNVAGMEANAVRGAWMLEVSELLDLAAFIEVGPEVPITRSIGNVVEAGEGTACMLRAKDDFDPAGSFSEAVKVRLDKLAATLAPADGASLMPCLAAPVGESTLAPVPSTVNAEKEELSEDGFLLLERSFVMPAGVKFERWLLSKADAFPLAVAAGAAVCISKSLSSFSWRRWKNCLAAGFVAQHWRQTSS